MTGSVDACGIEKYFNIHVWLNCHANTFFVFNIIIGENINHKQHF